MRASTLALLMTPRRYFAPLIASLFGNGEQGFAIIPDYTKSLFQDSAATIPAAVGMPVVKALDLSGRGNHVTFTDFTLQQDSAGNRYLNANGTSSYGVTASVDCSGTNKMTVFAGVYKASDAAIAQLVGLGANDSALAGSFGVYAPGSTASASYGMVVRGDSGRAASRTALSSAAPVTSVVTAMLDIGGAALADEIQGRVNGVAQTMTQVLAGPAGGGNFGNYPFYIAMTGGTTNPLNGRIYSLIVRGAACTAGQLAEGERLMARYAGKNI